MYPRTTAALLISIFVMCWSHESARAQASTHVLRGWGPQFGVSSGPDQAYLGVHFDLGRLTPRVHLRPGVELGFGGRSETLAGNVDMGYRLRGNWDAWAPYVGGGVAVLIRGEDDHLLSARHRSDFGFGALFGIDRMLGDRHFYLESRVGIGKQPDFSLGMGWTFH